MKTALRALPEFAQHLCCVVMFILKAQGICWKDRRGVALGQQSKGIHWVDLFIAWWRHHKPPEVGAYGRLSDFFLFYLRFPFETMTVSLDAPSPSTRRTPEAASDAMFLADPVFRGGNLLNRVDVQELTRFSVSVPGKGPRSWFPGFRLQYFPSLAPRAILAWLYMCQSCSGGVLCQVRRFAPMQGCRSWVPGFLLPLSLAVLSQVAVPRILGCT